LLYYLNLSSRNRKVGHMPVGYASRSTCPTSCVLRKNGCYAEQGPISWIWDKVDVGVLGVPFSKFVSQVEELIPRRGIWRYGVAGDLPGASDGILPNLLETLVTANNQRPVIAYTHKPVLEGPWAKLNRGAIEEAIRFDFNINLSADSPEKADRLMDLQLAPVVTVLPRVYGRRKNKEGSWAEGVGAYRDRVAPLPTNTPAGRRIAVCPATTGKTTCAECRACAYPRPGDAIIGFPAHGSQAAKAELAHKVARDVPVGQPWVFDHRSLAEVEAAKEAA
jgi:hypothetical protein